MRTFILAVLCLSAPASADVFVKKANMWTSPKGVHAVIKFKAESKLGRELANKLATGAKSGAVKVRRNFITGTTTVRFHDDTIGDIQHMNVREDFENAKRILSQETGAK
jgi:hypothetical protein